MLYTYLFCLVVHMVLHVLLQGSTVLSIVFCACSVSLHVCACMHVFMYAVSTLVMTLTDLYILQSIHMYSSDMQCSVWAMQHNCYHKMSVDPKSPLVSSPTVVWYKCPLTFSDMYECSYPYACMATHWLYCDSGDSVHTACLPCIVCVQCNCTSPCRILPF